MSRIFLALIMLVTATVLKAAELAAPFDTSSTHKILIELSKYEEDFYQEMSLAPAAALGVSPEQAYIYGRYMSKAFKDAGYSMDKTIYEYLKADRTLPVVLFMTQLELEAYVTFIKNERIANAFIRAGALSSETASYAQDIAREIPISNADYYIEGSPDEAIAGLPQVRHTKERLIGYIKEGKNKFAGWIYFQSFSIPGEENGIGLTIISETSQDELNIWRSLIWKKVKMEGTYMNLNGVTLTTNDGHSVMNPIIFDKTQDMLFKVL